MVTAGEMGVDQEVCVYCKETLSKRALERIPDQPEGWRCVSVKACARRSNSRRLS